MLAVAIQEIARLRAVADTLPKTRDGATITLGMEVHSRWIIPGERGRVSKMLAYYVGVRGVKIPISECYSSREAMLAAEEDEPNPKEKP
jgi:hypothetical protein